MLHSINATKDPKLQSRNSKGSAKGELISDRVEHLAPGSVDRSPNPVHVKDETTCRVDDQLLPVIADKAETPGLTGTVRPDLIAIRLVKGPIGLHLFCRGIF